MLFDVRTYTCRPGMVKAHLALYEKEGYPVQSRHLGRPLLYGTTRKFLEVFGLADLANLPLAEQLRQPAHARVVSSVPSGP